MSKEFLVFEDRVNSLLDRWRKFYELHSDIPDIDRKCINACLSEITDEFTRSLLNPEVKI